MGPSDRSCGLPTPVTVCILCMYINYVFMCIPIPVTMAGGILS